jgi:hypothetical protein
MLQQARSHPPGKDLVRMSMALNKGDTVKLTMKAAQAACFAWARARGIEWATRRGVVTHCTRFSRSVLIRWGGRRSIDIWPVEAEDMMSYWLQSLAAPLPA